MKLLLIIIRIILIISPRYVIDITGLNPLSLGELEGVLIQKN